MFVIPQKCFYLISVKLLKVLFLLYCFFLTNSFLKKKRKKIQFWTVRTMVNVVTQLWDREGKPHLLTQW